MEAAKRIKTPLDVLEKRYRDHLIATNLGNLFIALPSCGLADLQGLAVGTKAEAFCIKALAGLEISVIDYDKAAVAAYFKARPELMPYTPADGRHELNCWRQLY